MRRRPLLLAVFFLLNGVGFASDYNTIAPNKLKASMDAGEETIIVDICSPEMYEEGHVPHSIPTRAYPVKSDEDKEKLAQVLPLIKKSNAPVVIVCPRGAGGARRTYDYYRNSGISEERLQILEGGLEGWPYPKAR